MLNATDETILIGDILYHKANVLPSGFYFFDVTQNKNDGVEIKSFIVSENENS